MGKYFFKYFPGPNREQRLLMPRPLDLSPNPAQNLLYGKGNLRPSRFRDKTKKQGKSVIPTRACSLRACSGCGHGQAFKNHVR